MILEALFLLYVPSFCPPRWKGKLRIILGRVAWAKEFSFLKYRTPARQRETCTQSLDGAVEKVAGVHIQHH
jgi:hypothetical protein